MASETPAIETKPVAAPGPKVEVVYCGG